MTFVTFGIAFVLIVSFSNPFDATVGLKRGHKHICVHNV